MTKEEFLKLEVGEQVELLDLGLQRTGIIGPIVTLSNRGQNKLAGIRVNFPGRKKPTHISNEIRVAYPEGVK